MKIDKKNDYFQDIAKLSNSITVVVAKRGSDAVGAAVAIASYIKENFGKNPSVIYRGDMTNIDPALLELYKVKTDFEPKTLKVILDHKNTAIDSVNYFKEEDETLVLEISPVDRDFDIENRIKYAFSGEEYDLIITIGASKLEDFDDFYDKNKIDFDKATIINIDDSSNNTNFGKLNIVETNVDSLSGLVFSKFAEWDNKPTKLASKALLIGMSA